jgi:hypothetical protein
VILDVFSRYVVGWMVAPRESATLAEKLLDETCARHAIQPGQLTVHADRGSSMRSKLVAQLLADLGVTKTHSRPHVSNDNAFSEAGFRTLKYGNPSTKGVRQRVDGRAAGGSDRCGGSHAEIAVPCTQFTSPSLERRRGASRAKRAGVVGEVGERLRAAGRHRRGAAVPLAATVRA